MEWLRGFYLEHRFMVWGAGLGLIFAVLVLTVNLWRTLLLAVFIGAGAFLGSRADKGEGVTAFFRRLFRTN